MEVRSTQRTARKNTVHFLTDGGIEVPAVTAEEMREVDRIALEETGPNLYQMMENAGRSFALLAIEVLGKGWEKARVVVLAGSGGNGGGGICAARHLANHNVDVWLCLARPELLGQVPRWQRKIFGFSRGKEIGPADVSQQHSDLILDALIGYGLKSAPDGIAAELISWANSTNTPILALDVPSGMDATTGETPGVSVRPKSTMTLALPKTGLLPDKTGELFLADIGIPQETYRRVKLNYESPFRDRFLTPLSVR